MTEQTLDISVLFELFGDDDALVSAVLEQFRSCADPYLAELDQALAEHSLSGVGALAHKLKSSSRTIGALPLGEACEMLEQAARSGSWQAVEPLQIRLRALLREVVVVIDQG